MKTKLTEWLVKPLINEVDLPIKVGDDVLMGRFKNKRVKVKSITYNEKGDLQINGRPALKFRIQKSDKKLLPTKTTNKSSTEPDSDRKGVDDEYPHYKEAKRIPRKKGQHRGSSSHSDLYTDENPKGTIKGLKFATTDDAKKSVSKIRNSGKSHAHKIQAAVAMEQRAKEMGKTAQAGVYRSYINSMKKKTKKNEIDFKNKETFQTYNAKHKMRPTTKVNIAGKDSTVGDETPDNYERIDNKKNYVKDIRDYTDKEYQEETGEYFENEKTMKTIPKLFKDKKDMIKKMKSARKVYLSSEKMEFMDNTDVGDILKSDNALELGKQKAKEYGKKWDRLEKGIKSGSEVPPPIAIKDKNGDYYLLAGNTRMMSFTASGKKLPIKVIDYEYFDPKTKKSVPGEFQYDTNESFFGLGAGDVPSPSRKMVKKMKKKGNTSVPYGSGYKKIDERAKGAVSGRKVHKNITGFNLPYKGKKYKEIDMEVKKVDNKTEKVLLRILTPKKLFGQQVEVTFKELRRGPFMKTDTSKKVNEQTGVKKVVAIYPGRFQPFGPHHKKVFEALKGKFDEVYIATSNIQGMPRHPLNFNEKKKHMIKMGIPAKNIIQEKNPYKADILRKFGDDTAAVYVVGKKDAGRLSSGKYFKDFKFAVKRKDLEGYQEHGYVYSAPHQKVSGISSGTEIRNLLGSPKVDGKKREKIFKQTFGYFDKKTYEMMTSRFGKLFEFYQQPQVKKIIKEVSGFGTSVNASEMSDEGMYDFFGSLDDYYRISPEHADILGWEVIDHPIKDTADMAFTIMADEYEQDRTTTVTYGKTINQNRKNTDSVANPFPKYKEELNANLKNLTDYGWEVVKFFGEESVGTPGIVTKIKDVTPENETSLAESFVQDVKKVFLTEGGAYGHMNHPFDDNNLMFSDLKNIVIIGLEGKLNREDNVSEKLDGQNLMISWVDGKLKAARNKGHLKNGGKTAPTTAGIANMFSGRGNIKKAFVGAMRDLEKSIGGLSKAQKKKVFGNGTKWMNLEVIYPQTANIIDYDVAEIVFHGTTEYDRTGRAKGYSNESARMLQGMIKQINQNIQKTFKISKPNFLKMSKVQDFGKKKSTFLNKLNKLQSQYGLKDTDNLGMYHQSFWQEYIFNAAKQFNVKLKDNQLVNLTNRWAFFDKSYSVGQIKKDFKDNPEFIDWILKTDKLDHNKMFKQNIKPFEVLFFQVGAEILKNISGFLAVSPDKAVQKIRQDMLSALKDLQKPDNVEKLNKLKIQIEKLEAIGGTSAIVPSEGLVFKYKGNIYKFTGAFAPINQILGSLRF